MRGPGPGPPGRNGTHEGTRRPAPRALAPADVSPGRCFAILLGHRRLFLWRWQVFWAVIWTMFFLLNNRSGKRHSNFERAGFHGSASSHKQQPPPPPPPPAPRPSVSRPGAPGFHPEVVSGGRGRGQRSLTSRAGVPAFGATCPVALEWSLMGCRLPSRVS